MNWEALGAIGEIVGAVAVVVTLGYLAVQMRQNTRSVRASMFQSLVEQIVNFNRSFTEDPELAQTYLKGLEDLEGLSEADRARMTFTLFSHFQIFQSMYYQRQLFTIEPEYWESWRDTILMYYRLPGVQRWWQLRKDIFSKKFREFLEAEEPGHEVLSGRETVERLASKGDSS
jgi:hypothetical protein